MVGRPPKSFQPGNGSPNKSQAKEKITKTLDWRHLSAALPAGRLPIGESMKSAVHLDQWRSPMLICRRAKSDSGILCTVGTARHEPIGHTLGARSFLPPGFGAAPGQARLS